MKPFIDQSFWSDPDIESSKAGVKLTALWLITNSQTSILGLCSASVARFMFETGLPAEAIDAAIKALPRAFEKFGAVIFVKNYVRHQFGVREKLVKNNFFVALKSQFHAIKDEALQSAVMECYPEFGEHCPSVPRNKRDHVVSVGLRKAIFERDGFQCLYTGEVLPESELEVDHIIPRAHGGRTSPENLMTASKEMNTLKNNLDLDAFCAKQAFDLKRVQDTIKARASKPLLGFSKPKEGKEGEGQEREGKIRARRKRTPLACPAFAEFWASYPKREAVADAEQAWIANGCAALLPQILAAVLVRKSSAGWTKDGGQFIPLPATWLNRRGWEDQPVTATAPAKPAASYYLPGVGMVNAK